MVDDLCHLVNCFFDWHKIGHVTLSVKAVVAVQEWLAVLALDRELLCLVQLFFVMGLDLVGLPGVMVDIKSTASGGNTQSVTYFG